jgi:hypothetical protein
MGAGSGGGRGWAAALTGSVNVAASDGGAAGRASSSTTLSCRPSSSFPSSFRCSAFCSSSAKNEAKSAPLMKSRSASLNKAVEGKAGARAGGGGNSRGGMSARLAIALSPCTAAPGEASGRFVPRGDGAWRGDCPLRPNGARARGGGMGRVQEEEAEEEEGAEEGGAGLRSAG